MRVRVWSHIQLSIYISISIYKPIRAERSGSMFLFILKMCNFAFHPFTHPSRPFVGRSIRKRHWTKQRRRLRKIMRSLVFWKIWIRRWRCWSIMCRASFGALVKYIMVRVWHCHFYVINWRGAVFFLPLFLFSLCTVVLHTQFCR